MKEQLKALYELQALDVQITRIKTELAATVASKMLKMQLDLAKAKTDEADKALTAVEIELKDSELKLKSIDEKRVNFEKRMYGGSVTNPKELSSIEKEIALLKTQQKNLDGRTLELYELVEKAQESSKALRDVVAKVEAQLGTALSKETVEREKLEAELAELEAQRAAESSKITNKTLMTRYEAVRAKNGSSGIAKVVDGRCEGCRVGVTTFTIRNIYANEKIELCENCHRILYIDLV